MSTGQPRPSIFKPLRLLGLSILLAIVVPFPARSNAYGPQQPRPFLFEVEKDGRISYILGSMHAGIPIQSYPDLVFKLAEKARVMAFEGDPEKFWSENQEAFEVARFYPDGDSLDHHLSQQALSRLKELLGEEYGNPYFLKFRPWVISGSIDAQAIRQININGLWDSQNGIDLTLLRGAQKSLKPLVFLDDMSLKFDQFNRGTTAADLERLLSYPNPRQHIINCMLWSQSIYLAGRMAEFDQFSESCENPGFLEEARKRTESWVPRMEPLLATGKAFIVVGAYHLIGPRGLWSLLSNKGYKIRRMDGAGTTLRQSTYQPF